MRTAILTRFRPGDSWVVLNGELRVRMRNKRLKFIPNARLEGAVIKMIVSDIIILHNTINLHKGPAFAG